MVAPDVILPQRALYIYFNMAPVYQMLGIAVAFTPSLFAFQRHLVGLQSNIVRQFLCSLSLKRHTTIASLCTYKTTAIPFACMIICLFGLQNLMIGIFLGKLHRYCIIPF